MGARVLWATILVLAVAIGVWYVEAHQATGAPAAATTAATSTASSGTSAATTSESSSVPPTMPSTDLAQIRSAMVGTWQSADDGNYHIKISADGRWTDSYGTSTQAAQTGTYKIFTNATPDKNLPIPAQPGIVYLKVAEGNSTFYYSIIAASDTTLQFSYLARGNTLAFVRVQ